MGIMEILQYIIGGLLIVLAIAIVVIIGLQQSKRKSGLSNSIAGNGASESYLSRNKIATKDSVYKKVTIALASVFAVLVIALFVIGAIDPKDENDTSSSVASTESSEIFIEDLVSDASTEASDTSSELSDTSSESSDTSSESSETSEVSE